MNIVDENGNILYFSEGLQHRFGEGALGKKCWELYRDDHKQCDDCPLQEGIKPGLTESYEAHGVLGGKIFEVFHTGMIYNGQKAMLEIFIDITDRKKLEDVRAFLLTCGYPGAEENFFESLARYLSQMLNMEYVCIDKLDGDGLTAQTVAIFNDGKFDSNASYTLNQTPCGDVVGKTICCFPENVCTLFPHDAALQDLKAESYVGTTLWSFDGKPIGLIAIIGQKTLANTAFAEDVLKLVAIRASGELERIKVEDDLIAAKEQAEESDRLKSAFLANMSHEIRTPMNGILGFAELLKAPELNGEQQLEYLGIIERSGHRMLNIINDIVDISKIESRQMKLTLSETNVNEQMDFVYKFFENEVGQKGLDLSYQKLKFPSEYLIKTDREKLYSILTNLIKNAIKYTPKGMIEFGCGSTGSPTKSELQFFVKDTGIGIPYDRQEAIFERFIQADIVDKMARQGAGLGLAISKAYVEMLGGKIWVESEEGKGSTFYFTLPISVEPEEKIVVENIVSADIEENTTMKLKILIAEDDESSSQLISIAVQKFGKEIIHVQTGTEAVEAYRNNPDIDLVLMDIQMPEMDGHTATRQIRQFNKDVIIIAQTAYGLTGDREKSLEAGCTDYISKPIRRDDLESMMQKYFGKYLI
jgi:signal transduction histidine kinase/CheY-like chemotaxis protein